jgi:hypothetical protein
MSIEEILKKIVKKPNDCIEWTGPKNNKGYGSACVNGKVLMIHRLIWELEKGPIPKGIYVCHCCDNPSCINIEHLFLGTQKDNMRDCMKKGRFQYNCESGERNQNAKLTLKLVSDIRKDNRKGTVIAKEYGISESHVSEIKSNKYWKQEVLNA